MTKYKRVVLYEDIETDDHKCSILKTNLKLDEQDIALVNTYHAKYPNIVEDDQDVLFLVYTMGKIITPWANSLVVAQGPAFDLIGSSSEARAKLKDHLLPGLSNVFAKYIQSTMQTKLQPAPEPKKEIDLGLERNTALPTLEGSLDEAIRALQFAESKSILLAVPEINASIGPESKENCMSYEEAIALLLFMKRLGATKLTWRNMEVLSEKTT